MAKAKDDMYLIWPEYFDSTISRSRGRRMPASLSVPGPNAEELFSIAKKLGLSPVLEMDRSFPSRWVDGKGRIKVPKKFDKTRTMRMIAEGLVRKRG
ncbi:MAG: signal recognition particle subunit SRP19/SEC65 family protein [Thermoplasmatota archaeon]